MWRFYALVALIWVALSPPLFTGGACTQEFNEITNRVQRDGGRLRSVESSSEYFRSIGAPVSVITPERCRESKPRFISNCGSATVVYAKVPVSNTVCRIYRDEDVKVTLVYDDKGRLSRFNTDMAPFKSLPIPFSASFIHWAR